MMKKLSRRSLKVSLIGLLLVCGAIGIFVMTGPPKRANLHRLAGMPPNSLADFAAVRAAILQRVPIGTSEVELKQFLHQSGAEFSPISGRRWPDLLCSSSSNENHLSCSTKVNEAFSFCLTLDIVDFIFDSAKKVKDITVEEATIGCL
jgi:hypothetical protein